VNGDSHLLIDRQINIVIIMIFNFMGGACPLGSSIDGCGPLLENRVAIMTTTTILSTGRRSLRSGPLLMHMNSILLPGRASFLLLLLT
jgi:hypothetical protein